MKIAQVCALYHPDLGGVATHVREISERMTKDGFEITVLTTDPSNKLLSDETINGVKVKRFRSWTPNYAYCISIGLEKYLKKYFDTFDIVHAHNYHSFPALYAAQAKKRSKLVFTPHYHGTGRSLINSLIHKPYRLLGKTIFEKSDRIICVSDYEKQLVLDHFKPDESNITVIPNGVDLAEFRYLKKNGKRDYKTVLYVGMLEKYKGVQYLIEALPKLDGNEILEIVGKGSYKQSLVNLCKKLGVEHRVRFFQDLPRNELLQRYVAADVVALLSKYEAFGIVVGEALASKTPCIVANTSALRGWVDSESVFGIDYPIDINKLTTLIQDVSRKNVRSPKLLDWSEVAEMTANLYSKLVLS
jgi:glycosyltransferase involved in cell wall biosynthesis